MKKISTLIIFTVLFFAFPKEVKATGISIELNGQPLTFDQMPVLQNGRVYIPIRKVTEATGGKVKYEEKTKNITIQKGETHITFSVNGTTAIVDGVKKELPKPILRNNRTLVPIRFVSENVGLKVEWKGKEKKVVIAERKTPAKESKTPNALTESPSETNPTDFFADELIADAEQYIGTKYKWGGSSVKEGFDCSALVQLVFANKGILLPRTTYQQVKMGIEIPVSELKKGDLVFFDTEGKGEASHVAIYVDEKTLFHSTTSKGVNYTAFNDYWKIRVVAYRRVL